MVFASIRKIQLLALSFCIIFSVFFTETLVVAEIEHDCCPKEEETQDCLPCLHIHAVINLLKNLRETVNFCSSPFLQLSLVQTSEKYSGYNFYLFSPVELKVRFNT
jgi:hypothetical protein